MNRSRFQRGFAAAILALCSAPPALRGMVLGQQAQSAAGAPLIALDTAVGYVWRQDVSGGEYGPYVDADLRQLLSGGFAAEAQARIFKPASSDDAASVYLEQAGLDYVGPWFTVSGGRRDLGAFLGPGAYFGAYSTMGERQLDSLDFTLPFSLSADIPDGGTRMDAPTNALTLLYVPNLFEADQTDFSGRQGVALAQVRVKTRLGGGTVDVSANDAYGLENAFLNGTVDEADSLDLNAVFRDGGFRIYADGAVQNLSRGWSTAVASAGASQDIADWCRGLLKTFTVEGQIPLGWSAVNPFTGGDPQNPGLAVAPRPCWFVEVKNTFGNGAWAGGPKVFYGCAVTNSVGDYTLARLSPGAINVPLGSGFGVGPRIDDLGLRAANYLAPAGIAYVGYAF